MAASGLSNYMQCNVASDRIVFIVRAGGMRTCSQLVLFAFLAHWME